MREKASFKKLESIFVFGAFLILFWCYLLITDHFIQLRLLDGWDVIFDVDPTRVLGSVAHGWSPRHVVHPHIDNFFAPMFRGVSKLLFEVGVVEDEVKFRDFLALGVIPFISAAKVTIVYYLMKILGFSTQRAAFFSLMFAASWAQLLFAGLPDTFAISAFIISLLMLYAMLVLQGKLADRTIVWIGIGFALVGITLTNVAVFGLILWGVRYFRNNMSIVRGFVSSGIVTAAVLVLTVSTSLGVTLLIGDSSTKFLFGDSLSYDPYYVYHGFIKELVGFPAQIGLTFFGLLPSVVDNPSNITAIHPIVIQFSYETLEISWAGLILGAVSLLLIFIGFKDFAGQSLEKQCVLVMSLAILIFNAVLHSIVGLETYLYAPHWQVSAFLLLALGLHRIVPETMPDKLQVVIGCLAFFILVGLNYRAWNFMEIVLRAYL